MSTVHLLEQGNSYCMVDPVGGQVINWQIELTPILYSGYSKKRSGIPVLFPYFSVSKNRRQHGFGRDSTWRTIEHSSQSVTLELTHEDIDDKARSEYPHQFRARIIVNFHETELFYELHVTNLDSKPIPISPGLHPYWAVMHGNKPEVKAPRLAGFDAAAINWDSAPPDTMYPFSQEVVIQFPDKELTIRDRSAEKNIKYICVWSQNLDAQDHHFICFEPVCGDKGEFDSNPIFVQPGDTWQMQVSFFVELPSTRII